MTNPETPTVERFDLEIATTGYTSDHSMERSDDGEWVRHADYLTLHAEHQRLREAGKQMVAAEQRQFDVAAANHAEIERLRDENARLERDKSDLEKLNALKDTLIWGSRTSQLYETTVAAEKKVRKLESDLARLRADKEQG